MPKKISTSLLVLNSIIWVVFATVYFFIYGNWLGMSKFAMGCLFLLDAFLYLVVAFGVWLRIKIIYYFGLFLILGNIILTVLDELGPIDFAILAINILILGSLILTKEKKFKKLKHN